MAVTPQIGIFGGRFDPPHLGHLALALAGIERFGIDDLHVTVVADAAHKASEAPTDDRLAMARLAFGDFATVELEAHRTTVDALEAARYDDPIFLVGGDELIAFPTWQNPERVLELARLGVATRPGYQPTTTVSPRVELFELEPHPVSSSKVRERVRRGEPIDDLVTPGVAAYIRERGLYVRDSRLQ